MDVLLYIIVNAVNSRAIGSGFWGVVDKIFFTRLLGSLIFAASTVLVSGHHNWWFFAGLVPLHFLYACVAVNPYSSVAMNGDASKGQLYEMHQPFVDYPMRWLSLPVRTIMQRRIWGTVGTGIGRLAGVPAVMFASFLTGNPWNSLYALLLPFIGLCYFLAGYIRTDDQRVYGELFRGGMLAVIFLAATGALL